MDFYLATGKLPPVAKSSPQNGPKDTSRCTIAKKAVCPNTVLDSASQTSLGNADIYKLQEDGQDQLVSSAPPHDTGASSSVLQNESADSEGTEYKLGTTIMDPSCSNSESVLKFKNCTINREPVSENCIINSEPKSESFSINRNSKFESFGFNNEINEEKVLGTPYSFETPVKSCLYYEPPRLEGYFPLDLDMSDMQCLQYEYNSSPFLSPIRFFTPPCVKTNGSSMCSPESILKIAAMSFPNTPSILRKRKCKSKVPFAPNKIQKVDGESVRDMLHTSDDLEIKQSSSERLDSQDGSLGETSSCHGASIIGPSGKAFNASPPYSLRSKRTAKQLAFTFDKECEGSTKSVEFSAKGSSTVAEDCSHPTKMGVT